MSLFDPVILLRKVRLQKTEIVGETYRRSIEDRYAPGDLDIIFGFFSHYISRYFSSFLMISILCYMQSLFLILWIMNSTLLKICMNAYSQFFSNRGVSC